MRGIRFPILRHKWLYAVGLLVLAALVLIPSAVHARQKMSDMGLEEQNKSASYYVTLDGCVRENMLPNIDPNSDAYEPTQVNWFDDNSAYGYVYPDGKKDCKNIMSSALSLWGVEGKEFLLGMGYKEEGGTSYKLSTTDDRDVRVAAYRKYVQSLLGTSTPEKTSDAASYSRYSYWWDNQCVVNSYGKYDELTDPITKERVDSGFVEEASSSTKDVDGGFLYVYTQYGKVLRGDGSEWAYSYKGKESGGALVGKSDYTYTAYGYHTQKVNVSCKDTAERLRSYASSYTEYTSLKAAEQLCQAKGYKNISASPFGEYTLSACINGYKNRSNPTYCADTYKPITRSYYGTPVTNDQAKELAACSEGANLSQDAVNQAIDGIIATETNALDSRTIDPAATCGGLVEGIGWVLCPILNAVAGLNDAMWGFTSALLAVSPIQQSTDGSTATPTYAIWQAFRNIANVALVIVFLIMIFSQLTGSGISNYGIKKTLPRLIVAAIAINASFFIIQIAVDLFNILGKGIYDIIDNLVPVVQPTWDALIGLVLGGGLTIAGIVGTVAIAPQWALMLLVVPAVTGFIALLAALLTLLFRQAIIPILAVLAPLAFVAYLLPNTKPWFDKWKNLLISMLMLFPLAALLFGGVKLAAAIVMGENSAWGTFAALIILTIPLFMLPFIARQSGPMLGKINSAIKGAGDKLVGKPVGAWADRRKALSLAKSDASKPSDYNLLKRARQGLGKSRKRTELRTEAYKAQGAAEYNSYLAENAGALAGTVEGSAAQAHIRGAGVRAEAEELKLAMVPLEQEIADVRAKKGDYASYNGNVDDFLKARAVDGTRSGSEREAAMQKAAALGRDDVIRHLKTNSTDKAAVERAITANAGALIGKAPDLVKGSPAIAFDSFTGADMAGWSKGTAQQFVSHIESLAANGDIKGVNAALAKFASASKDIQNNPTLQGQFSADAGKAFRDDIAALAKANPKLAGIDSAFVSIGPDGKIR